MLLEVLKWEREKNSGGMATDNGIHGNTNDKTKDKDYKKRAYLVE